MLKYIYINAMLVTGLTIMAFSSLTDRENSAPNSENELVETYGPIVVLELFTSQGCSSCPPADKLLQTVKKEYPQEVFALSYHVDYWNYIGWTDPFSSSKYSKKQREYNIKFRSRSNYTPQLVVNGKEHFVGSSSSKMYNKISDYKKLKSENEIVVSNALLTDKKISFDYNIKGKLQDKIIRTLLLIDERTTQVRRGENRNRTLVNSNIVVAEKSFAIESMEGTMQISVPEIVRASDKLNLVVLIENKDYDITAAAKHSLER